VSAEQHFAPGARFQSRYEILAELGCGSFGRVHKARSLATGAPVAIKIAHVRDAQSAADRAAAVDLFRREMALCAALSHPNIVQLIDSGEVDGDLLYAVFEYVPGLTLRELMEQRASLEPVEAVRLMSQVLDALSSAHAAGVVHRDLKPENIMITQTGARANAKVLDFGLGALLPVAGGEGGDQGGNAGDVVGTPRYAAPEQLRGDPPTRACDLYAWGLVLLECLTGNPPRTAGSPRNGRSARAVSGEVAIPSALRRTPLGHLIAQVTEKDPSARPPTAAHVLATLAEIERALTREGPHSNAPQEPERRQVSVVYVRTDMRRADGSVLTLDDLDWISGRFHAECRRLADRGGGTLLAMETNRVVVVFGYPRAHDDDARRAVSYALAVLEHLAHARLGADPVAPGVRVGLRSGLVIAHAPNPTAAAGRYELVGDVLRAAQEIAGRASDGHLLVCDATWQALRGAATGAAITEPVGVAGVERLYGVDGLTRLQEATGPGRDEPPLIGRQADLARLRKAWEQSVAGEPSTAIVAGEAGIGKSRLLRELRSQATSSEWLECRCTDDSQASPLGPIAAMLTSLPEPLDTMLERLGFDLKETLPLLTDLLSAPAEEPPQRRLLSPERARELTLSTIASFVVRLSLAKPVVFVIEDLHWADPTTLALLSTLAAELHAATESGTAPRLCTLLSTRAENPSTELPNCVVITLGRLQRPETVELARAVIGSAGSVATRVLDGIAARTEGVPLFIEEMSRMVADAAQSDAPAAGRAASAAATIPLTLRAPLSARLDAVSASARETAQLASAFGREFRYQMLAAASPRSTWELGEDVDELLHAGLLYTQATDEIERFGFKHSLLCDAAYDSMVRDRREQAHRGIANALERNFPDVVELQPELLARHYQRGGEPLRAAGYLHRAGDRALRRAAYAEARQHLEAGLAALEPLPDAPERKRIETELLTALGTVLFTTQGYATSDVEVTFERARRLCVDLGQHVSPEILSGVIGVYITRGDRAGTESMLPQVHELFGRVGDVGSQVTAQTTLGVVAFWEGRHQGAAEHLEAATRGYLDDAFQRFAREYGYDGGLLSYGYAAWNAWVRGQITEANQLYAQLERLAERSFDPYALPLALCFGMALAYGLRDAEQTSRRAGRLIEVSNEQRAYLLLSIGLCGRGGALTLQGQPQQGLVDIRQGLDLLNMAGTLTFHSYYRTFLAAALLDAGELDAALAVVDEELGRCATSLARFHQPELLRIKGEILARTSPGTDAEEAIVQGLDLAKDADALSWALRCATSLGRLRAARGDRGTAVSVLRPLCERFVADPRLPDLRDATELLAEIG